MKIPSECRWKATGRNLGSGGAAEVVEVVDKSGKHGSPAALKALRPNRPKSSYERFRSEISILRELRHPNIIEIIDFSDAPSFPYYVMPLHAGAMSLRQHIARGSNPFAANAEKCAGLLRQALIALECCEQQEIVHRDLSPANVLVLASDDIKLIDFGLCYFASGERHTLQEEGIGTPNYMAPECETGNPGSVSIRSDFYSLGKILWAAITNQEAFAREHPVFTTKSFHKLFPRDSLLWHLDLVFDKTIRMDPANRWKNSQQALSDCATLESLIQARALTVHELENVCPHCRIGRLSIDQDDWHLFHNPMPHRKRGMACDKCGYCFVRDFKVYEKFLNEREKYL